MCLVNKHATAVVAAARFKRAASTSAGSPSHSQRISSPLSCVEPGKTVCAATEADFE
jgi:hypothetical protein